MAHRDPGRSRVMAWGLGSVVAHERHCTGPTQVACALADEANPFDHMVLPVWRGRCRGEIRGTPLTAARLGRYAGTSDFGNGNPALRPGRRGERHRQQLEPEMPRREAPGGPGHTRQMQ